MFCITAKQSIEKPLGQTDRKNEILRVPRNTKTGIQNQKLKTKTKIMESQTSFVMIVGKGLLIKLNMC